MSGLLDKARKRHEKKKKPFDQLTWKDVLVYLEQAQEEDEVSGEFRSPILGDLPRTGDFFNLGTAALFQVPSTGDRLKLTAWTLPRPVPDASVDLEPPFRLRLTAGIPQVLTGQERTGINTLAMRWDLETTYPVALPLVAEPRTLLGALVLFDPPPFDLEDETFVLAWTQYKYTLIQGLHPRRVSVPAYSEARLMRTLENGHSFLAAELDLTALTRFCDDQGLPHHRVRLLVEKALVELTGQQGAVLWRRPRLTALFVLPQTMDQALLWHQIEMSLKWPEGFEPRWNLRTIATPQELQSVLGR